MTVITFQDRPPDGDRLTGYDENHLALYMPPPRAPTGARRRRYFSGSIPTAIPIAPEWSMTAISLAPVG